MKALSLTQPWASLVAKGAKRIETRNWFTSYHGILAIHAAKKWTRLEQDLCYQEPFRTSLVGAADSYAQLPRGVILATCQLVMCVPIREFAYATGIWDSKGRRDYILPPCEPEQSFGDYTAGRFAWVLEDIRPLTTPIPARGSLGLWDWVMPDAVREEVFG